MLRNNLRAIFIKEKQRTKRLKVGISWTISGTLRCVTLPLQRPIRTVETPSTASVINEDSIQTKQAFHASEVDEPAAVAGKNWAAVRLWVGCCSCSAGRILRGLSNTHLYSSNVPRNKFIQESTRVLGNSTITWRWRGTDENQQKQKH